MSTVSYNVWALKVVLPIIILCLINGHQCSNVKSIQEAKPDTQEVFQNYRAIHEDKSYYYLESAGLLHDPEVSKEAQRDVGYVQNETYTFDSNEILRKSITWLWYATGTDRTARHVYDDPKEMELAAGPQVNQRWCKLHLDYMLYMVKKHHKHVTDSSEISIFNIMNSFGSPTLGFASGNKMFPGDYRNCIENKLNVMKRELVQVNRQEAEQYFNQGNEVGHQRVRNLVTTVYETVGYYIGTLFGYVARIKKVENKSIKKHSDKLKLVPTRYCMAALRWPNWPNSSYYKRNMALRSATCLPETCDSRSIQLYHDKIRQLTEVQMPEYFKGYYISHLYCLPDENSELRNPFNYTKTTLHILFQAAWLSIVAIATLLDYKGSNSSNWLRYLSYWSMIKNGREFWAARERKRVEKDQVTSNGLESKQVAQQVVDLNALEGLKVISSIAVLASHALILTLSTSWNANHAHAVMSETLLATVCTICPSSVDCFFVITGLLTSVGLMKLPRATLMKPFFWVQFLALRYIRVIPYYLVVHWSLQALGRFAGSGPLWDYGTSRSAWANICINDSLWNILFPLANFKRPVDVCNPPGWYLANDIQISLVTPFIILLYLKKPLIGHLTVLSASLAVMLNHILYFYRLPEGRGGLEFSAMTLNYIIKDGADGYTNPQYRCLAYFVGLAAGQLLYQYKEGQIKQWPRYFVPACKITIWSVVYFLCLGPYLVLMFPLSNRPLVHLLGSIVGGSIHGLTSLAVAAMVLLLSTGHLPGLNNMLSWSMFRPFANASLSTLLIHIPIIYFHTHTQRIPTEVSVYLILTSILIWTVETLAASTVLHIFFELPIRKILTKCALSLMGNKQPSQQTLNEANQVHSKVKTS